MKTHFHHTIIYQEIISSFKIITQTQFHIFTEYSWQENNTLGTDKGSVSSLNTNCLALHPYFTSALHCSSADIYIKGAEAGNSTLLHYTWGNAWCNGQRICFPSLSPMLEYRFKSLLDLNFRAFVCGIFWSSSSGVSPGTSVSSPLSSVNGLANKIKEK